MYKDTLHYSTGCDSLRRSVSLTVQAPAVSMMNETICAGLSYTLPSGKTVNTSGIYRDTLRYATGCDSLYRIVTLTVTAAQATDVSKTICSDQTYRLPWGVVVNTSGIYIDTVRTSIGCDSLIRRVNLTVNPKPVVNVSKSNDVTCALATTKLQVTGGVSWQWSPAASLSDPYAQNPVASPTTNTVYQVIVTGANGCQAKGSISVFFATGPGNNKYLVPSAFTPNGDGQNDCFGVPHWGRVSDFALTIFNRYGHTVFQTNDPSRCWDGVYKGERQNSAALVYIITAKGVCGDISRKGTVMLIR